MLCIQRVTRTEVASEVYFDWSFENFMLPNADGWTNVSWDKVHQVIDQNW